ncbi:MAG TPA: chorismate mutase [Candidatus Limnocylindrales bacterium]|nr:chorismate mutase [Candidatus Limnocylindrales bacterium]
MAERQGPGAGPDEPAELRRLRRRIDAVDRRIVRLLNDRAELAREVGRVKATTGLRAIRDPLREREVLLRVSMANDGPTPQADLLAIFKRLFVIARSLERRDRNRERRAAPFGGVPPTAEDD